MHFLILMFTWPVSNDLNPNLALAAESLDTSGIYIYKYKYIIERERAWYDLKGRFTTFFFFKEEINEGLPRLVQINIFYKCNY